MLADFARNKNEFHLTDTDHVKKLMAINNYMMQSAMKYAMKNSIPLLFERVVREYRADWDKHDHEGDYLSRAA